MFGLAIPLLIQQIIDKVLSQEISQLKRTRQLGGRLCSRNITGAPNIHFVDTTDPWTYLVVQ